jgi:TPR repeat protein
LGYLLAREYEALRKEGKLMEGNASTSTHDPLRIIALLTTASKKGDANGAVGLGYVYLKGIGAEVNLTRALNYFYTPQ